VLGNRGFLASGVSLNLSLLGDELAFAGLSLRRKIPFPAHGGDRLDDWVVNPQFEPNYRAFAKRTFPVGRQTGRFCGDIRPPISRTFVSVCAGAFERGFLAPVAIAKRLTLKLHRAARGDDIAGFNRPLRYQKLVY
jgi:hypothetical protein